MDGSRMESTSKLSYDKKYRFWHGPLVSHPQGKLFGICDKAFGEIWALCNDITLYMISVWNSVKKVVGPHALNLKSSA